MVVQFTQYKFDVGLVFHGHIATLMNLINDCWRCYFVSHFESSLCSQDSYLFEFSDGFYKSYVMNSCDTRSMNGICAWHSVSHCVARWISVLQCIICHDAMNKGRGVVHNMCLTVLQGEFRKGDLVCYNASSVMMR